MAPGRHIDKTLDTFKGYPIIPKIADSFMSGCQNFVRESPDPDALFEEWCTTCKHRFKCWTSQ